MTYFEKLRDPRWQKKRLEVMQRDGFKCRQCGSADRTLTVHHCVYIKGFEPWDYNRTLITLCEECHEDRHLAQTILLWAASRLSIKQIVLIANQIAGDSGLIAPGIVEEMRNKYS